MSLLPIGRLHVLTDTQHQRRWTHAAIAAAAVAGGADTVQFRHKPGTPRDRAHALQATVAACRDAGIPCLVDDHLDLALAAEAAGVHLGQTDLPIPLARRVADQWHRPVLIGATATTLEDARRAEAEGADYIGFGPVFPTASKANPASVKGLDGLGDVCAGVRIPVVAIAGITPERVQPCLDAGAWGVAVLSAVTRSDDPTAATAVFRAEIDAWLQSATPGSSFSGT